MPETPPFTMTKIVSTIGPATNDVDRLLRLVEEGLRVVRLNLSHGSLSDHEQYVRFIRKAAERADLPLAILGDLPGPKIRVVGIGQDEDEIHLTTGDLVAFDPRITSAAEDVRGQSDNAIVLGTTHPGMVDDVQPGERVLIDDGRVRMLAVAHEDVEGTHRLTCRVTQGGSIGERKGVNLPDTHLSLPSVTDNDWQWVQWAIEQELDYLALSFVRSHRDIEHLREGLERMSEAAHSPGDRAGPPIIAKIETPQALDDLEAIIDAADAIMVARGDLGVEMDPWEVPIIQKRVLRLAHDAGKPVIVATQMLQSMIEHSSATRAEISDIANAVMDGADALMLSGETAIGQHPEAAVRVMRRAALAAETYTAATMAYRAGPPRKLQASRYRTAALAHGVSVVVRDLEAKAVVVWSEHGGGARYLSQNRLAVPILAASASPAALRRMSLMFGVQPILMARPADAGAFLHAVDTMLLERDWIAAGDAIVLALGEPLGRPGVTNELRIHYVGDA